MISPIIEINGSIAHERSDYDLTCLLSSAYVDTSDQPQCAIMNIHKYSHIYVTLKTNQ